MSRVQMRESLQGSVRKTKRGTAKEMRVHNPAQQRANLHAILGYTVYKSVEVTYNTSACLQTPQDKGANNAACRLVSHSLDKTQKSERNYKRRHQGDKPWKVRPLG